MEKKKPVLYAGVKLFVFATMVGPVVLDVFHAGYRDDVVRGLVGFGVCEASENEELFTVDVVKQKTSIEKEFSKIEGWLRACRLNEARGSADLIEHKMERIRKSLSGDESNSYESRLHRIRKAADAKEDSLVNLTLGMLRTQGVDPALQFMQNDLRAHGVRESKINATEKKILEEAPAIKQAQERTAIARALKILESGGRPDSSIDPYIVKTAESIIRARADSVKRADDEKKRKEMEEREKVERARIEKEMKEKRKEDERLAKQKEEWEKQRTAEERKRKKLLAQREKAVKDSLDAEMKIQKRKAEFEKESRRRIEEARKERKKVAAAEGVQPFAVREKALKDSLEAGQKARERLGIAGQQVAKSEAGQKFAHKGPEASMRATQQPPLHQQAPAVASAEQNSTSSPVTEEQKLPRAVSRNAREYLQKLQEKQKEAQDFVLGIYKLLEQGRGKEALEKFKEHRESLVRNIDGEVFNVLEQSVMQSILSSQPKNAIVALEPVPPVSGEKKASPDQERIDRINGLIRENKIQAAYAEYKRNERNLKKAMPKDSFMLLKSEVENAFKTYKNNNK